MIEKKQIGDPTKKPFLEKRDSTNFKKPFKGGAKSFKKRKSLLNPLSSHDKGKGKFGDKPQNQGRPPVKCYECGGPHFKRNCPKLKKEGNTSQGQKAVVVVCKERRS